MRHKIVIRRHRPWLRSGLIAAAVALLALSGWGLYSYTRAKTVSDFARARTELDQLRDERRELTRRLRAARSEVERLKSELTYAERSTSIDSQACASVRDSLQGLQGEASDLREQLAFYRAIAAPDELKAGVRVQSLQVTPAADGRVRYRLTLIQSTGHAKPLGGKIEMSIRGRLGKADKTLGATALAVGAKSDLLFSLRYFEELGGEWQLPPGFSPQQVLVSLIPDANGAPKVEQKFDWQRILAASEKVDEVR